MICIAGRESDDVARMYLRLTAEQPSTSTWLTEAVQYDFHPAVMQTDRSWMGSVFDCDWRLVGNPRNALYRSFHSIVATARERLWGRSDDVDVGLLCINQRAVGSVLTPL
jgi:hypothetical protein